MRKYHLDFEPFNILTLKNAGLPDIEQLVTRPDGIEVKFKGDAELTATQEKKLKDIVEFYFRVKTRISHEIVK